MRAPLTLALLLATLAATAVRAESIGYPTTGFPPGFPPIPPLIVPVIAIVGEGEDFTFHHAGNVLVWVPFLGVDLHDITLISAGDIQFGEGVTIRASGTVEYCDTPSCPPLPGTPPEHTIVAVALPSVAGDVTITALANIVIFPIPEPSAALLMGLGLAGLAAARRRTRAGAPSSPTA